MELLVLNHTPRMNFFFVAALLIGVCHAHPKPLEKRIYTTNDLKGFAKNGRSVWPPGYGGEKAYDRVVIDIGANNGDTYTLFGYKKGHTIVSFEPSPMVGALFRSRLQSKDVPLKVLNLPILNGNEQVKRQVKVSAGNDSKEPKVYFIPVALSNKTGVSSFHQSPCANIEKCGKSNHMISNTRGKSALQVPTYRLDDITLPWSKDKLWLLKIDVEGHELQVLQGARDFLKKTEIPYIALEFSSNGRPGTKWGVSLLEELHGQGYACYHLRGFGKCQNPGHRSPSLKCNYPASKSGKQVAPTFEEYTIIFSFEKDEQSGSRRMADMMCAHRKII